MTFLGFDCGSSSVKAAVFKNGRPAGGIVHGHYKTSFDGIRAEVDPNAMLRGLKEAIAQLGPAVRKVDHIALDVMAPSWVAMDAKGAALTPIITHQDRRSVDIAHDIERRVGKARHLKLSGNRPIPGGISSTTFAWFNQHEPALMKKADLVGHLSTFIHRTLTGARVTDPSNASFTGLYSTLTLGGWNDELCEAVGVNKRLLPDVLDGDRIGGTITREAARRFGLTAGTPVLVGVMDSSATLMVGGVDPGKLLNVCGSTDVLALCTDTPKPDAQLLTRAVGVGRRWVQVATIAAAGSSLTWANREFFAELSEARFRALARKLVRQPTHGSLRFDPYLAGDRTSLDQKTASFTGLSLATTRDNLLSAMVDALAVASAARLPLLEATGTKIHHDVLLSGGLASNLAPVLHRDWPGHWSFTNVPEATLKGLAKLTPRA